MPTNSSQKDKEVMQLTDVEVDTLGLVSRGAIGEEFLLTKSDEGESDMPGKDVTKEEPVVTEEVEETPSTEVEVTDGLIDKLKAVFVTKEEKEVEKEEPEAEVETEPEEEPEPVAAQSDVTIAIERLEKTFEDKVVTLEKANEDLRTQIEKAEATAQAELEKRERQEYVMKADNFLALPVKRQELGDKLYVLSKGDDFDWWMALLEAADKQLGAAGIFNEMGTTRSAEELEIAQKVEKAVEEGKTPKEAILELSAEEQARALSELRGEA